MLNKIPNLRIEGYSTVSLKSKNSQQVKVDLVDNFGDLFKGAKSTKATLERIDGTQGSRDVSGDLKFNKDNNIATLALKET